MVDRFGKDYRLNAQGIYYYEPLLTPVCYYEVLGQGYQAHHLQDIELKRTLYSPHRCI